MSIQELYWLCDNISYILSHFNYRLFYRGGLQPGDIVTEINGKRVQNVNDIYEVLGNQSIRLLKMTVVRYGQRFEVKITPEDST